jgi:membrane associated rhomboid family serine protease
MSDVMARPERWQQSFSFGGRLPWSVGLLIVLTLTLSLGSAFGDRHVGGLFGLVSLQPAAVWHLQLWRLITWTFVEASPWGLLFACLALYWFGPPLALRWGSPRFLTLIAAAVLLAGTGTCLIALADPQVMGGTYLGTWTMTAALVVSWGLTYPDNVVRIYFVLPVRGFWFAWLTVGITVVMAVYSGWAHLLPELIAEGAVLAWFYRGRLRRGWAQAGASFADQRRAAERARDIRTQGGVVVDLRTGEPVAPKKPDDPGVN